MRRFTSVARPLAVVKSGSVALIAGIGILVQFFQLPNHDAAWLFAVARRMSGGATLYSADLVEINPPLIIQVSGLAIRLGQWLGIESMSAWRLLVGSLTVLSLWLSARLLRRLLGTGAADLHAPFMFVLAAALACLPGYDFGQRDHLILLCLVPYVTAAAARAGGTRPIRWETIVVGLMAAFALSLKPHYLLALLLIEIGLISHRRSWTVLVRTETVVLTAGLVSELVLIAVQYPQYFTVAIPMALEFYPSYYGAMTLRPIHAAYLVLAMGAIAIPRTPRAAVLATRLFALAGAGAFAAFVAQGKDWPYHFLPTKTLLLVTGGFGVFTLGRDLVGVMLGTKPASSRSRLVALSIGATVLVLTAVMGGQAIRNSTNRNTRRVNGIHEFIEAAIPPGRPKTFSSIALTLWPAFPVNELLRAQWMSRFSCLWLLSGIQAHEASGAPRLLTDGNQTERVYLETALSEDLDRWRPTVVLVERNQPVVTTLLGSPRLSESLRHYRIVGDVDLYRLYVRDDDGNPVAHGTATSSLAP